MIEALPLLMFAALALFIFTGFPVAFVLAGVGLLFGFIGWTLDVFTFARFTLIPLRIYGGTMENLVLVAIPMFIFMGTMLEKSGVAEDLLNTLQVLTRRLPGGLALSVTLMGTILAATTGIIGASVVLMTLMALPVMMQRNYHVPLAAGTIAASGTLGNPDSPQHHAGDHGRPAVDPGRHALHRRGAAGPDAGLLLHGLHPGDRRRAAGHRPAPAG